MAAVAAEARVFLEVRRRLQSALLILGVPDEGGLPMDVCITPTSLQMKSPGGCTELWLPAGVRLVPSSCRGLRHVAGDGLHLRLQARAEFCTKLISVFNQRSQAQECCTFYCQSCGEIIMRNRKLLRVLPLPHENWGALVDEWCCHPNPFANKPLHPQENDCFTGDCFFLVNLRRDLQQPRPEVAPVETRCLSSENHLKMKPKANTKVICKRCKVMLGETVSSETTKFYMTEIIIQPSERNFPIIPRLASSWESDVSVHSLTLPSATCLELLLILSRSNATLPPSLRCMNSFQETEENQLLQGAHLEHTYTHRHESLARPACHPCSLPAPVITGALTIRIIADCPSLLVTVLLLSVHLLNMIARGTHTFPSFKGTEKLGVGSQTMSAKEILSLPLPLERCILIKNTPGIDFPTQVFTPR
ncbi:E3 ubiquitin-protein ligase E3D isoform X3 [Delphinapterus leucas]|uniref:E3 ubiquitin-protein ligase E3D n=1 Tax=Delphinapterus leucas TaxID=9749 RepID=A0A7F8KBT6_DELLE|nr:E3 ubiquitin-protein ligase E3D isoform X3 [Delphinapterus leucas]